MLLSNFTLTLLIFANIVWLLILSFIIFKAFRIYRLLTAQIDQVGVAEILAALKKQQQSNHSDITNIDKQLTQINTRLKTHVQKIGFIRYNPFGNTGGDQSFCLCLLDEHNSGIMITSLHTRDQTRIYSKMIAQGKNKEKTPLSKEEIACITQAQQWSKHE